MNFFWVYDLPTWLFATGSVAVFILFGLICLYPTRAWVRRQHRVDHSHNDIVGFYLAAITVFYGITLGLLAAGAWASYSDVQSKVDHESETLVSLYRDIQSYPEPAHTALQNDLKDYTYYVINTSWPQQRKGIIPRGSGAYLARFQKDLLGAETKSPHQDVLLAEIYKQFNDLIEARRGRLNAVNTGMPAPLWTLMIVGAFVTIVVTIFFDTASFSMHFWMTVLLSGLLGLMIFLVAALDYPFRGTISVSPASLQSVYDRMVHPESG